MIAAVWRMALSCGEDGAREWILLKRPSAMQKRGFRRKMPETGISDAGYSGWPRSLLHLQ